MTRCPDAAYEVYRDEMTDPRRGVQSDWPLSRAKRASRAVMRARWNKRTPKQEAEFGAAELLRQAMADNDPVRRAGLKAEYYHQKRLAFPDRILALNWHQRFHLRLRGDYRLAALP
jgi:hypothetical protein